MALGYQKEEVLNHGAAQFAFVERLYGLYLMTYGRLDSGGTFGLFVASILAQISIVKSVILEILICKTVHLLASTVSLPLGYSSIEGRLASCPLARSFC